MEVCLLSTSAARVAAAAKVRYDDEQSRTDVSRPKPIVRTAHTCTLRDKSAGWLAGSPIYFSNAPMSYELHGRGARHKL
jgi:hypothetical protein